MQKTREIYKRWYWRIWTHGTYLDLWSVPHTLFGVIMAYIGLWLGWELFTAYLMTFILAFIWEAWEIWRSLWETWQNRVLDIVTAIIGFLAVHEFQWFWNVSYLKTAGLLTMLWSFFTMWGWVAWLHRVKS